MFEHIVGFGGHIAARNLDVDDLGANCADNFTREGNSPLKINFPLCDSEG